MENFCSAARLSRGIPLLFCTLAVLFMPTGKYAGAQTSSSERAKSALIQQLDAQQSQTIVVYGTSLTAGGAWVNQLSSNLNAKYPGQITWVNAALSGKASASGVANFDDRVLSKQPDAVFIEFAMNDAFTEYPSGNIDEDISVEQARANLEEMITRIQPQHADAQVVLQTMNPSWDAPNGNGSGTKRPNLSEYYQMYRDVAAERDLLLIDNNSVWLTLQENDPAEFAQRVADGTHPDATGYARLVTPAILHGLGADNGLVLLIDMQSGQAVLRNQSDAPLELISYTISSSGAALSTSWSSLADQQLEGWHEANPSARNLSELNPTGSELLAVNEKFDLGTVWTTSGALDLSFDYQTVDGVQHSGLVVYTTGVDDLLRVAGDYNGDGTVNLADYTVWRNTLGSLVPLGTGADGNANGVIDAPDHQVWKMRFSTPGPASTATPLGSRHTVTEPTTHVLSIGLVAFLPIRLLPRVCQASPGRFFKQITPEVYTIEPILAAPNDRLLQPPTLPRLFEFTSGRVAPGVTTPGLPQIRTCPH